MDIIVSTRIAISLALPIPQMRAKRMIMIISHPNFYPILSLPKAQMDKQDRP